MQNFLTENTLSSLKNGQINRSFFEYFEDKEDILFILNHNASVVEDIINFLNSDDKLFVLNGFMGSGKSVIIDILPNIINDKVLFFKNIFYPATNLDDVLLSLFNDFAMYHNKKQIVLPKVDSSVFSEKINTYIKSFDNSMLFVFDSLELVSMSKEQQKNISDFILYLKNFDNVKIVVVSRSFDEGDLPFAIKTKSSITKMVDKDDFVDLLKKSGMPENDFQIEMAYKNTKGHYLYVSLLVNLLKLLNISVSSFLNEYSRRDSTFSEFLIFKILGLIPDRFLRVMCFLAFVRHGVSENFVIKQNLASKEDIVYLKSRMIVSEELGLILLKDYMKSELIKSIDGEVKQRIHKYLYDLYDSQLPKKPSARDLIISRATMRMEMDYHKKHFAEAKTAANENVNFSYLSYAKGVQYEWQFENSPLGAIEDFKPAVNVETPVKTVEKPNRFELSSEELALLNSSNKENENIEEIPNTPVSLPENSLLMEPAAQGKSIEKYKETFEDWIQIAQKAEELYDYNSAVLSYQKALTQKDEPLFDVKKPLIMTKLAICYRKLHNIENAINEFEKVYQIYAKDEIVKANYILLSIAQIYNEAYKFSQAKDVYFRILDSQTKNPTALLARVYLDLSDIEDNNSNIEKAVEYCKKALIESENSQDLRLLSEVNFKYALLMDDSGNLNMAISFYLKCISTSQDINLNNYLSSAYANLAGIYTEQNNKQEAIKLYTLSIEADEIQNNYEGLYFGFSKLARITWSESSGQSISYLIKALDAAKKLDDNFYAASAYLDLGDFYYTKKVDDKALKSYIQAKNLILKQPNEENIQRVNTRINDLKVRLGDAQFAKLMEEFQKG